MEWHRGDTKWFHRSTEWYWSLEGYRLYEVSERRVADIAEDKSLEVLDQKKHHGRYQ